MSARALCCPLPLTPAPACSQINYYAQLSGQSREKVALDLDRDNFLSAQEAMAYGLVDRIVE